MSVNKVILLGNLTADPETRGGVTKVRIATNERWKDREGALQERTEYHRVTFFGRAGEIIGEHCRKGRPLYVEGRIQTSEYEKDGERRWSTEIVAREFQFVGSRQGPLLTPDHSSPPPTPDGDGYPWREAGAIDGAPESEEIPF